jgi:hypothetical protein
VPKSLLALLIQTSLISITEEEIKDRSKSDPLAKIIVLCQTLWFIAQSVTRGVEGLSITNLEILTNAFAVLNFVTYFLWWNKPQRVRFPIVIDASETEEASELTQEESSPEGVGTERSTLIKPMAEQPKEQPKEPGILKAIGEEIKEDWKDMQDVFNNIHIPQWFIIRAFIYPFLTIFMQIWYLASGEVHYQTGPHKKQVGIFFVVISITVVFGGIHCIPWAFQFPSHEEQILWRVCALLVTCIPIGMFLVAGLFMLMEMEDMGFLSILVPSALYIVARMILIVLALMELRTLPSSAYQTVEWTTLIPHI